MSFFQGDFASASRSCLKADADSQNACLQSLGLMVSNPTWQSSIAGTKVDDTPQTYINLCQKFPKDYLDQCIIGTIDNIMNFDQLDIAKRAIPFCLQVNSNRQTCLRHIVFGIKSQSKDSAKIAEICSQIESHSPGICKDIL